ncbi:YczE/YyaS/YitT family protein [Microbacterium sp.]|uniref:membrane protein YczE n=1 Tax=Microbacterium sp. TaxID=51671 RepID=UPI003C7112D8
MRAGSSRRLGRRILQLLIGLFLYGLGIALMIRGVIGAAPWDVLSQGLATHLPLTFGTVTIIVSGIVLLMWIPLRQRMGIGTILNALLIGPSADVGFLIIPVTEVLWIRVISFAVGLTMVGAATGLYIGARFGPGPRDGLMTGLHRVTGRPIWVVRTALEVTVVVIGWLLGGNVGIGTVAFALLVGPLCQYFMRIFDVVPQGERPLQPHSDPVEG